MMMHKNLFGSEHQDQGLRGSDLLRRSYSKEGQKVVLSKDHASFVEYTRAKRTILHLNVPSVEHAYAELIAQKGTQNEGK